MKTYTAGQVIHFTSTFTDASSGALLDPSLVTFSYSVDSGPVTHLTWNGTLAVLTVGSISRASLGVYAALIDTTGLSGAWTVGWRSTGTGQTVVIDSGRVVPNPLA